MGEGRGGRNEKIIGTLRGALFFLRGIVSRMPYDANAAQLSVHLLTQFCSVYQEGLNQNNQGALARLYGGRPQKNDFELVNKIRKEWELAGKIGGNKNYRLPIIEEALRRNPNMIPTATNEKGERKKPTLRDKEKFRSAWKKDDQERKRETK